MKSYTRIVVKNTDRYCLACDLQDDCTEAIQKLCMAYEAELLNTYRYVFKYVGDVIKHTAPGTIRVACVAKIKEDYTRVCKNCYYKSGTLECPILKTGQYACSYDTGPLNPFTYSFKEIPA